MARNDSLKSSASSSSSSMGIIYIYSIRRAFGPWRAEIIYGGYFLISWRGFSPSLPPRADPDSKSRPADRASTSRRPPADRASRWIGNPETIFL